MANWGCNLYVISCGKVGRSKHCVNAIGRYSVECPLQIAISWPYSRAVVSVRVGYTALWRVILVVGNGFAVMPRLCCA